MSRPPKKALEQIKAYCEKTQCRRCIFGEKSDTFENINYIACRLQMENPCDWEIEEGESE